MAQPIKQPAVCSNELINLLHHKMGGWLVLVLSGMWQMLKEAGFKYLETRNLNQDPLENTFGVIRLHCGSNNIPSV